MTLNSNISGNFTQIEFKDELENLTSSSWFKFCYFLLFCVNQAVSLSCYSGFVYFEHQGGDPMKRSIKVQFCDGSVNSNSQKIHSQMVKCEITFT